MKSKKLISFLCALAMTVSSFAGLAVTASAATDVFTYTDGATTGWAAWNGGTAPGLTQATDETDTTDKYLLADAGTAGGERVAAYTLPSAAQLTDNYVIEFDSYIQGSNGMGRESQVTQVVFAGANAAKDTRTGFTTDTNSGEGVGKGFILKLDTRKSYEAKGVIVNDPADTISADWTAESNYVEDVQNQWTRTQAVVSGGKVTVKMIDANGHTLIDNVQYDYDGTTLSSIVIGCGRGDSSYGGGKVSLDNVRIYSGAAETLSTDGIKGAKTYITVPADSDTKKRIDNQDANLAGEDNFNSVPSQGTGGRIIGSTTGTDSSFTDLNVINLEIPSNEAERSSTDYWQLKVNSESDPTLGTDKIITAHNGEGSTANRGPRMYFKKDGSVYTVAEREYVIAEFATRLHASETAPAEVIFSGDLVASESVGNLASPLAMITTDADANSAVYAVNNPLEKGGNNVLEVNDNEWVFVTITAYRSEGKTAGAKIAVTRNYGTDDAETTYIFGSAGTSTSGYADVKDNTKSGVNVLPYITFRSGNSTTFGTSNTSNDIDNVKLFSTTFDPDAEPTPTPVPKHDVEITNDGQNVTIESQDTEATKFDGVLIHVHYDSVTNAPESVKSYPAKNIGKTTDAVTVAVPAGDTIYTGDKLMVWNSLEGMVPYGVYTVQSGETPAVKYAITATNPENGTYTVQVDGVNAASAEAGDEVTITATPAQGYELDTITVKDADNADVTVTAGKFTMPAKAVTVTVTFKALPTPKAITKAAATNGSFTVKAAGAEVESALADTVITVTPTADQDYKVGTVTVAPTDSSVNLAVPVTKNNDGTYTFTMPDVAVTVTVTFVDDSTPADPAITGTVAVTGDPIVGSKLTATVTGLNEGKTAKYQWQANTGDAGAYENIADATANELTIPATLVGKTIKVVVTADGTTDSIASDPTAAVTAPTYTVTGTLGTGVASAVLRPADATDATTDVAGTVEGSTVTYTVPAGTYTVVATAAADYKNAVSDPATVTVSASATTASFNTSATADPSFTITVADGITNGTVTVDKATAKAGAEVTITATPTTLGYELGTITVKDADDGDVTVENNKFTMPAKNVNVTATFVVKANTLVSTASTYLSRNLTSTDDLTTQASKNYSTDTKVRVGLNGNYNAIGLYQFTAPTIPDDKEIASAKLTVVNQGNDNNNGTTTFDVNYPNVSTGIDFSTITWLTMFTQATVDSATTVPFVSEGSVQESAPFKSITKLATSPTIPANTPNQTISNIDVTSYVKAQTKASEPIVLVLNNCNRGANLNKVAIIEYTLQDKHYDVSITAPNADTEGTITVDKANVLPNETVTITTTAVAGKKVTGVTVAKAEGTVETTALTGADAGKYTFTMPAEDVTVSATYDRADIETIEVSGPDTVSTSSSDNTYTAVAKAADGTVLTGVTFAWTVEGASNTSGTTITADGGVLTVAADEAGTSGKITVKATAEGKNGTKEVTVTSAQTYTATKADDIAGGDIAISPATAIEGATITVTPTAATGYHVTGVTYTDASDAVQNATTADEGATYTFAMPAKNTTVSATFAKTDYTITDGTTADANGTITVAAKANYQDVVEVTVTPAEGYELATLKYKGTATGSTVAETAITKDAETDKYTFTMPAEAVTVTATFEKAALPDRTPDGANVQTVFANASQTLKEDDGKSYTVAVAGDHGLSTELKTQNGKKKNIYTTFDVKLADTETFTLLATGAAGNGNLGPTFTFTTAEAESATTASNITTVKLKADTWYNVVISTVRLSNGLTEPFAINVYKLNNDDTVSTTVVASDTNIYARNIRDAASGTKAYTNMNIYGEVSGSPKLDNFFIYEDARYDATVTVTDGTNHVEGVTVTLNDLNVTEATTNASGVASFNVEAGSYTVTVAKDFYSAPVEAQTLVVAKGGENAKTIAMTEIPSSDVTFAATDAATKTASITDFTVVVKKGDDVVAPKEVGGKVYKLEQDGTYTYTITPTGDAAAAYDALEDQSLTVGTNASQTVTAELAVKTYSVTFTNVPAFTKITITGDKTAEVQADEYGKVDSADYAVTEIAGSGTISYKLEKAEYTTVDTTAIASITEDKTIDVSAILKPTTAGVLYTQSWLQTDNATNFPTDANKTVYGGNWQWYSNSSGTGSHNLRISTAVTDAVGIPVNVSGKDKYKVTLQINSWKGGSNTRTGKFALKSSNGKNIFEFALAGQSAITNLTLTPGSGSAVVLGDGAGTFYGGVATIDVTVDVATHKISGTYTQGENVVQIPETAIDETITDIGNLVTTAHGSDQAIIIAQKLTVSEVSGS